jgi:hypothetical protein
MVMLLTATTRVSRPGLLLVNSTAAHHHQQQPQEQQVHLQAHRVQAGCPDRLSSPLSMKRKLLHTQLA